MITINEIRRRYADNLELIFAATNLFCMGLSKCARRAPTTIAKRKCETMAKEIERTVINTTKNEIFEVRVSSSMFIKVIQAED